MAETNSHQSPVTSHQSAGCQNKKSFSKLYSLFLFLGLPSLTSLLLILSYPKFNLGFLAWFALAPLTVAILKVKNIKRALACGFFAGFFFYLGILYWIYITIRSGGGSAAVSLLGWTGLSFLLSLEFIIISGFGFYFKKIKTGIYPYVFAAAWAGFEWLKVLLASKVIWFPWFMLGYTQWQYIEMAQIVSFTGIYGLSFAVCFTGVLIGTLLISSDTLKLKLLRIVPAAIMAGGLFLYGSIVLKQSQGIAVKKNIKFSILQPSIDFYKKWDKKYVSWIEGRINGLLEKTGNSDIVVWPENSLPGWIDEPKYADWFKEISLKYEAINIVGSVSHTGEKYVSAFLIDNKGEISAEYHKRRLVPFGEYVPLRPLLSKYVNVVAELGEFERGALTQDLFKTNDIRIANAICYESIFPDLLRGDTLRKADIFVNITNDGWYLNTAAPYQHFLVNIFRAIENRRLLVRAANNGISAVIDPWGRTIKKLDLNEYSVLNINAPIYKNQSLSFYSKHGNWFAVFCFVLVGAFVIVKMIF